MKTFLLILTLLPTLVFSQSFREINENTFKELKKIHKKVDKNYFKAFKELLSKRDTTFLKKHIDTLNQDLIYLIEGYNFQTKEYGIYESHQVENACLDFLNGKELNRGNCFFRFWKEPIQERKLIDTIFPRKYQYGHGDVMTTESLLISIELCSKAEIDGIIIEPYCKIETIVYKKNNKIVTTFLIPKKGKRECETNRLDYWPPGLDFWLTENPYIQQ